MIGGAWQADQVDASDSAASPEKGDKNKRPFVERWWWLLAISAWAWLRLLDLAFGDGTGSENSLLDVFAVMFLIVAVPFWLWERRRQERKRGSSGTAGQTG